MSDRARGSVRTEARGGSGTSEDRERPDPADDTVVVGSQSSRVASPQWDDVQPAGARGSTPAEGQPPADGTSREARAADGKGADPRAGATAVGPADAQPRPAGEGNVAAPPAAHPITPLGPSARQSDDGARPVNAPNPPVPATGSRPAVGRSGVPAGSLPVDSTQAVTVPPAARPADPVSRPAGTRPADPAPRGTADQATRTAAGKRGAARGPRRARLQLRHIDTWSALKISLVVSIALFFVWMVAVAVLYGVLSGLGVFDTLNDLIGQLSTASGSDGGGGDVISAGVVFWSAAVIGAVNIVLLTALCTVAAFVYNLCSDLVGGLEVTLAERDQ